MKLKEKQKAIALRKSGMSMGEIAQKLGVAKSSISYWVRDVALTAAQRKKLNKNGHSIDAIEKRRIARTTNTRKRRENIMEKAIAEYRFLSKDPLWCVGVALYWGEGGKTQQTARIANSDPYVIIVMMSFFKKNCGVKNQQFRGHVHTFSHLNAQKAEAYWSKISGIPVSQFYKTYTKPSSASKHKKDSLPYGTFQIYVHDTELFFRIMGWIEACKKLAKQV